jgi:excisionase family DNA binding protein
MDADKGVFTVEEAASYLRVSRQTIWRLIRAGTLPAGKVGRAWRIRRIDVEALLTTQQQAQADESHKSNP